MRRHSEAFCCQQEAAVPKRFSSHNFDLKPPLGQAGDLDRAGRRSGGGVLIGSGEAGRVPTFPKASLRGRAERTPGPRRQGLPRSTRRRGDRDRSPAQPGSDTQARPLAASRDGKGAWRGAGAGGVAGARGGGAWKVEARGGSRRPARRRQGG